MRKGRFEEIRIYRSRLVFHGPAHNIGRDMKATTTGLPK